MPILKSKKIHFLNEIKPARIRFASGDPFLPFEGACLDIKAGRDQKLSIRPLHLAELFFIKFFYKINLFFFRSMGRSAVVKKASFIYFILLASN